MEQNKFKVGAKVRLTNKRPCLWSMSGQMDKYLNSVVTIKRIGGDTFSIEEDDGRNLFPWAFMKSDIVEYITDSDAKILITTDGTTTTAKLLDGEKTVKTAEAKCNPNDKFDFLKGAELAFNRLIGKEEKKPEPQKEPIKLYCVEDRKGGLGTSITKGNVYKFENGDVIFDGQSPNNKWNYDSYDDFARCNRDFAACFVPLVKRPAKVGEWVYVLSDYEGVKKGDICEVIEPGFVVGRVYVRARKKTIYGWDELGNVTLLGCGDGKYLVLDGYNGDPEEKKRTAEITRLKKERAEHNAAKDRELADYNKDIDAKIKELKEKK